MLGVIISLVLALLYQIVRDIPYLLVVLQVSSLGIPYTSLPC